MGVVGYESTKRQLIEAMRATIGEGSRQFDIARAILEVKGQEDMTRATRALVLIRGPPPHRGRSNEAMSEFDLINGVADKGDPRERHYRGAHLVS